MQKFINAIAIASGIISLTVVGSGVVIYLQKDAIIDGVKSKIIESVSCKMRDMLPDRVGGAIPGTTGPALPAAPLPKF